MDSGFHKWLDSRFQSSIFSLYFVFTKKACSFLFLSYIKQFLALPERIVNIGAVSEVHIVEEILTRKIYSYFNNNNGLKNNKRGAHCQNQRFSGSNIIPSPNC